MTNEEIKSLMRSGDVAGAENAAQELLSADPDNIQAMILYGTCRQLLGDETTFRDTYATVKERLDAKPEALDEDTKVAWDRFGELYAKLVQPRATKHKSAFRDECIVLAVVVLIAVVTGAWFFGGEFCRMCRMFGEPGHVSDPSVHFDPGTAVCCAADIDHRPEEAGFTEQAGNTEQAGKEF